MNYLDVIKPFLLSEVDREFNSELDNIFVKKQFDENYTQSRKQEVTKKLTTDSTFYMKMTYDDFINDFNNGLKLLIDNQIKPYYRANVEINENQKSEVVLDSSNNFLYLKSEISLYSKVRHELLPIIEYLKDLEVLHYINTLPSEQSVSTQDNKKTIPNNKESKTKPVINENLHITDKMKVSYWNYLKNELATNKKIIDINTGYLIDTNYTMYLIALLKHLHIKGYYGTNKPSDKETLIILKNSFGITSTINTVKHSKPQNYNFQNIKYVTEIPEK